METTPLEVLTGVMQGRIECTASQLRAAIAAAQYVHAKKADGGKKDDAVVAAKKAASKFKPATPPLKLVP